MHPPTLILLPGMMLDQDVFAAQSALLRTYRPMVGDLTRSSSIAGLAQDVLTDAPDRFALAGLSMGGIVALEIYRRAPERITHLALLDTTPHEDRPERSALRMEHLAAVERGELAQVLHTAMTPLYLAQRQRSNVALLDSVLKMGLRLGAEVFRRQTLALRDRRDNSDMLENIRCPTLVLCGREDQLCPREIHVAMAQAIPEADLVVLSGVGHLSPLEAPDRVSSALRELLERAA